MAAAAARAKARAASRDGGRGGGGPLGAADVDSVREDESKSRGENARAFLRAAADRAAPKPVSVAHLNALAKMWERRRRRRGKEEEEPESEAEDAFRQTILLV